MAKKLASKSSTTAQAFDELFLNYIQAVNDQVKLPKTTQHRLKDLIKQTKP